jgi:phosphoglycolate phosphatase
VAALESFRAQGATLAVCTNKREYLSRKLLSELDLARYFSGLAGRDTFSVSKPDPRHLTQVIALAGGNPSRAIMVGDSEVDIATAEAAAIPMVLVSFGYANTPLDALRAAARIDHFDELEAQVTTLLNGLSANA